MWTPDRRRPKRRLDQDDDETALQLVVNESNRETHLTSFNEAIKMATDNKINSTNTWNYALIDYFYDMNLLRSLDGSSINFQRAGATLDGCMKIFSHRIDSVASETGKLLSGLGEKGEGEGEQDDNQSDIDDETKTTRRKRHCTTLKSTITDFDGIKLKHYERELNIDPLFKKTLADFDEGGIKSLLMNSLSLDSWGRLLFVDSIESTAALDEEEAVVKKEEEASQSDLDEKIQHLSHLVDIKQDIIRVCSMMEDLEHISSTGDAPEEAKDVVRRILQQEKDDEIMVVGEGVNDFDMDVGEPDDLEEVKIEETDGFDHLDDEADVKEDQDIMHYFNENASRTWGGPQHWKISLIHRRNDIKSHKSRPDDEKMEVNVDSLNKSKKSAKEPFKIDFMHDTEEEQDVDKYCDKLFKAGRSLDLPKHSKMRTEPNCLPLDLHWSSEKLMKMFLKPNRQNIGIFLRRSSRRKETGDSCVPDEAFWAQNYNAKAIEESVDPENAHSFYNHSQQQLTSEIDGYDADDYGGNIDFNMQLSTQQQQQHHTSSQRHQVLGRSARYSKVAKKVDVKLLKDNLWDSTVGSSKSGPGQKLSAIAKDVSSKYGSKERGDLSTSFFFICMLHLANEHDLQIQSNEDYTDLEIMEPRANDERMTSE